MNISKIQTTPNFYNTQKPQKREFIDIISDNVRNPRDVNDCVAVPRGIFKAYIVTFFCNNLILYIIIAVKKENIRTFASKIFRDYY